MLRYRFVYWSMAIVGLSAGGLLALKHGGRVAERLARFVDPATTPANAATAAKPTKPMRFRPHRWHIARPPYGRLLLDEQTVDRIQANRRARTPAWRRLEARCSTQKAAPVAASYQAFEWADAIASLTLCWKGTGDAEYARVAVGYFRALLDDRAKVGDGNGGTNVVRADSGYGIRTYGAYTALGYDWLREAPGMDPALRRHALDRLASWIDWYGKSGYLNDTPIANYYWGYLSTMALAGLAAFGDDPRAKKWLDRAAHELEYRVLPTFTHRLSGGDWPEGWQYGEYVAAQAALVTRAFKTAAGIDLLPKFPWLGQTVVHHTHALLPGERSVYDGGTWGELPAKPSALAMWAVAFATNGAAPKTAAKARYLADELLPPLQRQGAWLAVLGDYPSAPKQDPRVREPKSHLVKGTGLSFMRSSWSGDAVWLSFKAGPRLAADHQDKDEGHFELWRGADGLIVDGGSSEGSATLNHNTLLIDDGGRHLTYPPNQGVWGYDVKTTAFADDGRVVVARGDLGEAYAPACVREGCSERTVKRFVRTLVYVRPNTLLTYDDVELDQPGDAVRWAAHFTEKPRIRGDSARAVVGSSRVDVVTLVPRHPTLRAPREPTTSADGPHEKNEPWRPMWRLEVEGSRAGVQRTFLHWIVAGPKQKTPKRPRLVEASPDVLAASGTVADRTIGVVLVRKSKLQTFDVTLPKATDSVVVTGLDPHATYATSARSTHEACRVSLRRGEGAARANSGGFVRFAGCSK